MVGSFANDTITRIRPGTKSVRGSDVPDWGQASSLVIAGCSVQPASTMLSQDGRVLGIMDGMTCYCPYDADVQEGDRIQYDGLTYVINGAPRKWKSPTGNRSNMQLNLERWKG